MKINTENIDERIFDYFEGNLKEDEKLELMNFIHLHPEYEKDFAVWAQSYTIKDEPLKDYELNTRLIKDTKPSIYKPLYYIVPGIILLYFLFETPTKESTPQNTQSKIVPTNRSKEINTNSTLIPSTKNPVVLSNKKISSNKNTKAIFTEPVIILPAIKDTNHAILESPALIDTKEATNTETITQDKKETIAIPAKKEEELAPKRKKKKLIDLKPSPEFIPVNENF